MTVYRSIQRPPDEWRRLLRRLDRRAPLADGPHGRDCARRRLHALCDAGDLLGVPVGVVVEIRSEDSRCEHSG